MAIKGQAKFDEFSLIILGGVIFLGILVIAFQTPGEFPPKVTPSSVNLDLDPGSSESFELKISPKVSGVNVSTSGAIASWIELSETDIGATGSAGKTITATVSVPPTATSRTYNGKIIVFGREGKAEVDVNVFVSAVKTLTSRTLLIGSFDVLYHSGVSNIASHEGTFISKSYLFEKPLRFDAAIPDDQLPIIQGGTVSFVVTGTNNYGPIVVTQNGKTVFSEVVGPGEVIVPINVSDAKRSNVFTIESGAPGFFFWAENLYEVRDVSIDVAYEGSIPKVFDFILTPQEQDKFDHMQLAFVIDASTFPLPPLKIELNDQIVFFEVPPRFVFNEPFETDIFGKRLNVADENTLTLSFGEPASYEVSGASLTVFARAR